MSTDFKTISVPAWVHDELKALRAELLRDFSFLPPDLQAIAAEGTGGQLLTHGVTAGLAVKYLRESLRAARSRTEHDGETYKTPPITEKDEWIEVSTKKKGTRR